MSAPIAPSTDRASSLFGSLVAEHLPRERPTQLAEQALRPRLPYEFDQKSRAHAEEEGEAGESTRRVEAPTAETPVHASREPKAADPPAQPVSQRTVQIRAADFPLERHEPVHGRTHEPESAKRTLTPRREIVPEARPVELSTLASNVNPELRTRAPQEADVRETRVVVEKHVAAETQPTTTDRAIERSTARQAQTLRGLRPRLQTLPPPLPTRARPSEPVIEIHIGRVEVRAAAPSVRPSTPARTPDADRALTDYLRGRGAGARS